MNMFADMKNDHVLYKYIKERVATSEIKKATGRNYHYALNDLFTVCDKPFDEITRQDIVDWLANEELSASTKQVKLVAIRVFYKWAEINDLLTAKNPTLGIQSPKTPHYVPKALHLSHVTPLLDECDERQKVIVLLMIQEGLRCMEVANLKIEDIDFHRRIIQVLGKGEKERILPLSDQTAQAIKDYVAFHPTTGPLLRSTRAPFGAVKAYYVSRLISRVMTQAGIKQGAHDGKSAHSLRHRAASDVLLAGGQLRDVQDMLGHSSIKTTERYIPFQVKGLQSAMGGRRYG